MGRGRGEKRARQRTKRGRSKKSSGYFSSDGDMFFRSDRGKVSYAGQDDPF